MAMIYNRRAALALAKSPLTYRPSGALRAIYTPLDSLAYYRYQLSSGDYRLEVNYVAAVIALSYAIETIGGGCAYWPIPKFYRHLTGEPL